MYLHENIQAEVSQLCAQQKLNKQSSISHNKPNVKKVGIENE